MHSELISVVGLIHNHSEIAFLLLARSFIKCVYKSNPLVICQVDQEWESLAAVALESNGKTVLYSASGELCFKQRI